MAKVLPNGLLVGRVGNLIYYVVDNKQYVRTYVVPNNPKTDNQERNRAKVKACGDFLSQFKTVIKVGYQGHRLPYEPYNEAVKYHLPIAFEDRTAEGSKEFTFSVIPEKVRLSRGMVSPPEIFNCQRIGQAVHLTWNTRLGTYPNRNSDALAFIAWIPGIQLYVNFHAGLRLTGQAEITLPASFSEAANVWVFYWNADKKGVEGKEGLSESVYLGVY